MWKFTDPVGATGAGGGMSVTGTRKGDRIMSDERQNDGLFTLVALTGSIWNGPSNAGKRHDGKICTAKAGECRLNYKFYTPGMRDAKSWSTPCADDTCPNRCGYLSTDPAQDLPEDKKAEIFDALLGR